MEKYELLLKPNWSTNDIEEYFGVGHNTAFEIKINVERIYGTPPYYADKTRTNVKTDNVIEYMGGTSRMEEMQLLKLASEINKNVNE